MSLSAARRVLVIGLGMLAGAVLPPRTAAQVPTRPDSTPTRRDTLPTRVDSARARQVRAPQGRDTIRVRTPARADSMVRNDSLIQGIVPLPQPPRRDTVKAPLARAEGPPVLEIGAARVYDRTALFATGALTLSDLLGRVPGLTEYSAGFLLAPALVASQGDLRRIRIFLDGLEIDPLDQRAQGTAPVNELPIHALEEVRIERGAEEVRVHARSWRVDRTTSYTRADVMTGDQNSNLYRAFFGRRYDRGEALQVAVEQSNTQPNRGLPSSGALHLMARAGLSRGSWSADLFGSRTDRDRGEWTGGAQGNRAQDTIPGAETRRSLGYLRLGNGDPERGAWIQMLLSAQSARVAQRPPAGTVVDTTRSRVDSVSSENQYLLTGGIAAGPLRLSGTGRVRVAGGRSSRVASGRASYGSRGLALSAFAEGQSALAPARLEGTARLAPFDRVALLVSASRTSSGRFRRIFGDNSFSPVFSIEDGLVTDMGGDTTVAARFELPARTNVRAEAGVRVRDLWVSGGILRRDATVLLGAAEIDESYGRATSLRAEGAVSATTVALRGRVYKALNVDAWAVAWADSGGPYRPKYQSRGELFLQTNLLGRFPRGNFGLLSSLTHEYRSRVRFPQADAAFVESRPAEGYRSVTFKLEIRVQTAVVSYQFRNLLQQDNAQIPGFLFPRQTQFYGVRWDFWN